MTTTEFRMPSLGADMESGTLVEWLVHPGDAVHRGDIVAVVDTAKANVEVECFDNGTVADLIVMPGTTVAVGTVLATIATDAVTAPGTAPPAVAASAMPPVSVAASVPVAATPVRHPVVTSPLVRRFAADRHVDLAAVHGTGAGGRITHADVEAATRAQPGRRPRSSPLARRLAAELGVDLASLTGSGVDGVIKSRDVRLAVTRTPSAPTVTAGPDRAAAMRAQIALSMSRSKREIPHYYLSDTVDLDCAMRWLRERNLQLPVSERLLPAALLLKAAAVAVHTVPDVNGHVIDATFHRADAVHLGVAISLRGGGLVAPAIHHADKMRLDELMSALKDLVARTRAGRLRAAELADPTITVSSLGDQGVESIFGVIYPPQVALVGFGAITERPWAVGGLLGVRPVVTASLAGDHRVTDGASGARYLLAIRQLLQRPEEL